MIVRQAGGSLPPVGAMPMSRRVGPDRPRERLVERRDERDVVAGQELATGSGPAMVESRMATTSSRP